MYRFQTLEKEINKGIVVTEKANELIHNWSPNNVRRLAIGYEFVAVEYFRTGGKYGRAIEVVDMRKILNSDKSVLLQDAKKYKGLLGVLVEGRICSSIEEIIFCKDSNYPEPIFSKDFDLGVLQKGNTTLESRFVRLRHISVTNISVRDILPYMTETKNPLSLVLDKLLEDGKTIRTIVSQHEEDWMTGSSLRPKYYSMDETVLSQHFDKVREKHEIELRESKLKGINDKRDKDALAKYLTPIKSMVKESFFIRDEADRIFTASSILSKAEWSNVLGYQNMIKGLRKGLLANEKVVTDYRKIDFEGLEDLIRDNSENGEDLVLLTDYLTFLQEVFTREENYKRESNQFDNLRSLEALGILAHKVLTAQVNMVYLSYVRFLTRNSLNHVNFFYDMLKGKAEGLIFTRSVIAYCNTIISNEWSKKAFDKVGHREVTAEEFPLTAKLVNVKLLLQALAGVK